MPSIEQSILDRIQPVVLVGGQSTRFGRDKLVEPVAGSLMVAAPINALREVFGGRVAVVGRCDARVQELADLVIEDPYPGLGPVGGICAALQHARTDLFVCAGDLISIDQSTIESVVSASVSVPDALACLAQTDRLHPTVGIYRSGCVSLFEDAIVENTLKLGMVLDQESMHRVPVNPVAVRNINHASEL